MRSVINGVRYDTSKSITIGSAKHESTGIDHWQAALYVTPKSKKYFLAGSGGPLTQFSKSIDGNNRTSGSGIIPLAKEDAFQWAQKHLDTETINEFFSDIKEA